VLIGRRNVMKKHIIASLFAFVLIIAGTSIGIAGAKACGGNDTVCKKFAALAAAGRFEKIVEKVNPYQTYSTATMDLIGQAYLMMAGRENNTPEQKEKFCVKALEYGATSAYLDLYYIHAGTDAQKALRYLKQYIATKPQDSALYTLLGETEFNKGNYAGAQQYLQEAKKVARGRSVNLDWLLFKASYLSGDYKTASVMLDSSLGQGKTMGDIKALVASDSRFSEMNRRSDFSKFFNILNGTKMTKAYVRP
jgi:tetratricopeptide (TPR) repeat protein